MSWSPRPLDPRWKAARERLQLRYAELARLPDASRLAYLRGPLQTVTEEMVAQLWQEAGSNPVHVGEAAKNLYIHVPFCKSICSFCNYERLRPSSPGLLEAWLKRVIRSMETIGPAVSGFRWESVYIGGGTPSTLPGKMIERLLTALHENLDIHPRAEKSFEFDPLVMSAGRVEVLKRFGFTHFSFGIQATDSRVSEDHNRGPQGREVIAKRFTEMYSAGIYDVACDMLLGLKGTTPDSILADIEWLLQNHKPKAVDVFQIAPTPEYVESHFEGDLEKFWEHLKPFQEQVPDALASLCRQEKYKLKSGGGHRYLLRRAYTPAGFKGTPDSPFGYNQLVTEADRPMHLLGFGPSARSQIYGYAAYQTRDPLDPGSMETAAVYQGHLIDIADEVRNFLIHCLRDGDEVDRPAFARLFGQDITEAVPIALAAWADEGLLEVDKRRVRMAPQGRRERALSLLWLVPDAALEHEIGRRQQLDLTPDGILRLCGELAPGTVLAESYLFGGAVKGRIHIRSREGIRYNFRVAPGLEDGAGLRLVLESSPPQEPDARKALSRAMKQVRGVMRRVHGQY